MTVTATLVGSSTPTTATTVNADYLSGTDSVTGDYAVTTTLASVTIAAGRGQRVGDADADAGERRGGGGDETVVGGWGVSSRAFTVSSATITLEDDDTATLSITGPASAVNEGSDATFTVTLSHAVDASVTVAWSAPGAGDDAEAADLGATSGDVTFPANSAAGATQTITIGVVDDMLSEGDETFTVTLGTITSGRSDRVEVATDSAEATIAESDPITVVIDGPATVPEGDSATYTVSLSTAGAHGHDTADLTVDYDQRRTCPATGELLHGRVCRTA